MNGLFASGCVQYSVSVKKKKPQAVPSPQGSSGSLAAAAMAAAVVSQKHATFAFALKPSELVAWPDLICSHNSRPNAEVFQIRLIAGNTDSL